MGPVLPDHICKDRLIRIKRLEIERELGRPKDAIAARKPNLGERFIETTGRDSVTRPFCQPPQGS
jgi:hypothetical protein